MSQIPGKSLKQTRTTTVILVLRMENVFHKDLEKEYVLRPSVKVPQFLINSSVYIDPEVQALLINANVIIGVITEINNPNTDEIEARDSPDDEKSN